MLNSARNSVARVGKIGQSICMIALFTTRNIIACEGRPARKFPKVPGARILNDKTILDTINSPWSAISQRSFWGVLNVIFNKYDESRVKAVGPDRACAEWLLRCGASVKWKDRGSWTKDYNSLPTTGGKKLNKIEEVDATDSAVMHVGFKHFNGCKHLRRIVFHKASYLTDEALEELPVLKATLKELQITSCGNISADGLRHLKKLVNLEYILLYDFPKIKDKDSLLKELEEALPNCAIYFPYSLAKDDPSLK
ncbi:unnamed protein product, partial [Meganyctiphanes norvegica]